MFIQFINNDIYWLIAGWSLTMFSMSGTFGQKGNRRIWAMLWFFGVLVLFMLPHYLSYTNADYQLQFIALKFWFACLGWLYFLGVLQADAARRRVGLI